MDVKTHMFYAQLLLIGSNRNTANQSFGNTIKLNLKADQKNKK